MQSQTSLPLLDLLRARPTSAHLGAAATMEDCFLNDYDSIDYDLNPTVVRSTIAIALSPDGATVATTHGDHTVKIFKYADASLFRVFEGHPRTPWTVKYHHTNADIVASGCLGFEVFVWCISENCKVNSIRYSNSIISLSFQPHGPYIAVATGVELRLWNWAEHARLSIDGPSGNIKYSRKPSSAVVKQYPRMKVVRHQRNIRAVLFHPFGQILLAAAPDVAKENGVPMSFSRLYAFNINDIAMADDEAPPSPRGSLPPIAVVSLDALPHILPQVHLYSDGGLDISADGRLLLICSILYRHDSVTDDEDEEMVAITRELAGVSLNPYRSDPVHIDAYLTTTQGFSMQSSLCLYKFNFPVPKVSDVTENSCNSDVGFKNAFLSETPYPHLDLLRYRTVAEPVLKAITSVKLSPTCRYGLLGYGVRSEDHQVQGHTYGQVASELISIQSSGLPMAAVMTDEVDEVNIAQFHPLPGGGLIYGTKRGRVRVFKRASAFKAEII